MDMIFVLDVLVIDEGWRNGSSCPSPTACPWFGRVDWLIPFTVTSEIEPLYIPAMVPEGLPPKVVWFHHPTMDITKEGVRECCSSTAWLVSLWPGYSLLRDMPDESPSALDSKHEHRFRYVLLWPNSAHFVEAETAAQYANELAEKHSADCPWRTAWCPGKLQYYQLQFTNEELNVLMQRASELEQLGSADIQSPKDLDGIPLPMGLAICGWKHEGYNHLECIFNCSEKVAVDALFHPLFDHRWCCPVVNLNTNSAEPTGWKAMLQLYNLKKKTT